MAMKLKLVSLLVLFTATASAQTDTEFPKGFIMYLKLNNGLVTQFNSSPDLYTGGLHLLPEFTVAEHLLRVGANLGAFYTDKKVQGFAGPLLSLKLKTIKAKEFGSLGNINLTVEHLWGTGEQRLLGAGINIDLLNKLVISLSAHRDYNLNTWWFQNGIAFRISKKKKVEEPFN
jgi:hypothetical protein